MVLDLENLSARRGFFDVHTPINEQSALLMGVRERREQQNAMREFCLNLRNEVWEEMGRPNKTNLRHLFKYRVHTHRHADLARLFLALGLRIDEINKIAATYRAQDKARTALTKGQK